MEFGLGLHIFGFIFYFLDLHVGWPARLMVDNFGGGPKSSSSSFLKINLLKNKNFGSGGPRPPLVSVPARPYQTS